MYIYLQPTEDQLNDYKEAFSLFDKAGHGSMETASLGDLLRALGFNPTQAQVKEMIGSKFNGQDSISFNQFVDFVENVVPTFKFPNPTLDELVQGFQVFDKEGNGFISVGELRYGKRKRVCVNDFCSKFVTLTTQFTNLFW